MCSKVYTLPSSLEGRRSQGSRPSGNKKKRRTLVLLFCTPSGCSCKPLCARTPRFSYSGLVVVEQECRIANLLKMMRQNRVLDLLNTLYMCYLQCKHNITILDYQVNSQLSARHYRPHFAYTGNYNVKLSHKRFLFCIK